METKVALRGKQVRLLSNMVYSVDRGIHIFMWSRVLTQIVNLEG